METDIIKIGNSKGIRISKEILEQCGFNGMVNMQVDGDKLVLSKAKKKVREGWAEAAKLCHEAGDDKLIFPEGSIINEFDKTEWTWPQKDN